MFTRVNGVRLLGGMARALFLVLILAVSSSATIRYTVSLADREGHMFGVEMTVPGVRGELLVQMPAWNALYQVRDFAHRVQNLRAEDGNARALSVTKLDKLTWRITGAGEVTIRYAVLWDDRGPFASQLDNEHAFLNLAMVLVYVPSRRGEDIHLALAEVPERWSVATAMRPATGTHTFTAPNYDVLVDSPIRAGEMEIFSFEENGARIRVAATGTNWNAGDLEAMLRKIVGYQTKLMADVPFEEFLFIYHFGRGGGGMEHADSTAIWSGSGERSAGVSAHEFFHLWNVKRIRPKSLEPVDYTGEQYTRALWFAEGVTSTYASFTQVRTGLITERRFYDDLARQINSLQSRPARQWQSVEQASLDAWYEKYDLHRRPENSISYYNKGQLLGVLLDVLIRDVTDNRRSLDDVLRDLNERYAKRGLWYDDSEGIRESVERVTGQSFESFFRRYVAGTEELPYADVLGRAGLEVGTGGERVSIEEMPRPTDKQRRIRDGLLQGTNQGPAN